MFLHGQIEIILSLVPSSRGAHRLVGVGFAAKPTRSVSKTEKSKFFSLHVKTGRPQPNHLCSLSFFFFETKSQLLFSSFK